MLLFFNKPFLAVKWKDLLVVNYRIDPEYVNLLEKHLPHGTELDDFKGDHYVSVVAFRFKDTQILGIPMPFYRDFPEINLRFYVRRKIGNQWRRGVVFIKEIIPHCFPAWVANIVFRENFHIHPFKCSKQANRICYEWDNNGYKQQIEAKVEGECALPQPESLEEHIIEHYWAYKSVGKEKTAEFRVQHQPWCVSKCLDAHVQLDLARVYGSAWEKALGADPINIFYADGSRVRVTRPRKIQF